MADDVLQSGKNEQIVFPYHEVYHIRRKILYRSTDKKPTILYECRNEIDVMTAIRYAKENNLAISIQDRTKQLPAGVLIDLSKMRAVAIDPDRGILEVEAGALLGDVHAEMNWYGLAVSNAMKTDLTIGELARARKHANIKEKSCDALLSVRMVTVNGGLLHVNREAYATFIQEIGAQDVNIGIITSFTFQLDPILLKR